MRGKQFPYEDILHLAHHVSPTRAKMSMIERAAQFAPFAALTGYDAAIKETARLTGSRVELDECEKAELDRKFQLLQLHCGAFPDVTVTYFVADPHKEGGRYCVAEGTVKKIDSLQQLLVLTCGECIPLGDIIQLKSTLFEE